MSISQSISQNVSIKIRCVKKNCQSPRFQWLQFSQYKPHHQFTLDMQIMQIIQDNTNKKIYQIMHTKSWIEIRLNFNINQKFSQSQKENGFSIFSEVGLIKYKSIPTILFNGELAQTSSRCPCNIKHRLFFRFGVLKICCRATSVV